MPKCLKIDNCTIRVTFKAGIDRHEGAEALIKEVKNKLGITLNTDGAITAKLCVEGPYALLMYKQQQKALLLTLTGLALLKNSFKLLAIGDDILSASLYPYDPLAIAVPTK